MQVRFRSGDKNTFTSCKQGSGMETKTPLPHESKVLALRQKHLYLMQAWRQKHLYLMQVRFRSGDKNTFTSCRPGDKNTFTSCKQGLGLETKKQTTFTSCKQGLGLETKNTFTSCKQGLALAFCTLWDSRTLVISMKGVGRPSKYAYMSSKSPTDMENSPTADSSQLEKTTLPPRNGIYMAARPQCSQHWHNATRCTHYTPSLIRNQPSRSSSFTAKIKNK